jgi:hypothetical protein
MHCKQLLVKPDAWFVTVRLNLGPLVALPLDRRKTALIS